MKKILTVLALVSSCTFAVASSDNQTGIMEALQGQTAWGSGTARPPKGQIAWGSGTARPPKNQVA